MNRKRYKIVKIILITYNIILKINDYLSNFYGFYCGFEKILSIFLKRIGTKTFLSFHFLKLPSNALVYFRKFIVLLHH